MYKDQNQAKLIYGVRSQNSGVLGGGSSARIQTKRELLGFYNILILALGSDYSCIQFVFKPTEL